MTKSKKKKPTKKYFAIHLSTPKTSGSVEIFVCVGKNGITKEETNFLKRKLTSKVAAALAQSMKPFYNVYPHEIIVR